MLTYTINGAPLANPTRWINEDGGGALGGPAWRGGDLRVPYATGETWLPWVQDVSVDEFSVWVTGTVDHTGAPSEDDARQFVTNLKALQDLLVAADGGAISVVKTLQTADGDEVFGPSDARCVSSLAPRMYAPWLGLVLVRLKVYDGWTTL